LKKDKKHAERSGREKAGPVPGNHVEGVRGKQTKGEKGQSLEGKQEGGNHNVNGKERQFSSQKHPSN